MRRGLGRPTDSGFTLRTDRGSECSTVQGPPNKRSLSWLSAIDGFRREECQAVPWASPPYGVSPPRLDHGYVRTQPPEPLSNASLHNDCTAKVPVERLMSADAPCPEEIHTHLSPFSAPLESSQPPFGNWSVIVSAIS